MKAVIDVPEAHWLSYAAEVELVEWARDYTYADDHLAPSLIRDAVAWEFPTHLYVRRFIIDDPTDHPVLRRYAECLGAIARGELGRLRALHDGSAA